jgi:hypothetical protein
VVPWYATEQSLVLGSLDSNQVCGPPGPVPKLRASWEFLWSQQLPWCLRFWGHWGLWRCWILWAGPAWSVREQISLPCTTMAQEATAWNLLEDLCLMFKKTEQIIHISHDLFI